MKDTAKHGHARLKNRSPTYNSWRFMRGRCLNVNDSHYKNYGGRGIQICARWSSFENFLADMGVRESNQSLGRIDNDGHYCPENCRWETSKQQSKTIGRREGYREYWTELGSFA